MIEYRSQKAYAQEFGVSTAAVNRACINGDIVYVPGEGIDPKNLRNRVWLKKISESPKSRNAQEKRYNRKKDKADTENFGDWLDLGPDTHSNNRNQTVVEGSRGEITNLKAELERLEAENLGDTNLEIDVNLVSMSRSQVDRLKIIEQIRSLRIATDLKRQRLVSRESVQRVFAQLYLVDSNELKTLGDQVSQNVAALCGVESPETIAAINQVIEKEVYKVLEHIKKLMDTFLKKCKIETLETEIEKEFKVKK